MKTILKYSLILTLLAGIFAFAACNEQEHDPFTGKDSYITAFSLKQGEAVFQAELVGDAIVITAPEGLSLNNAKATITLSENASIRPDPADITEWDGEHLFAVTAYNGASSTYKYKVERSGIAHNGSVVLETQADVDAFGQQGVTFIDGNLTIGRATGEDSITSLAALSSLKEVVYTLSIQPTFAGVDLAGLEKLEKVGSLLFGSLKKLETLALPTLHTAGSIDLTNTITFTVELPALVNVLKLLRLNCPLFRLHLPALKTAGGSLTLSGSNATLTEISLPALEKAESITVSNFAYVTKMSFSSMKKLVGLRITGVPELAFIYAPKLEEATGQIYLSGLNKLSEVGFPEMLQAADIYLASCKLLSTLDFSKLTHVGLLTLNTLPLNDLSGFSALQTAGTITMSSLSAMPVVKIPPMHIDLLTVTHTLSIQHEEIDVKGADIGELQIVSYAAAKVGKLIGDDVFRGTLNINCAGASQGTYPGFPAVVEGFHEVDSLYLQPSIATSVIISGVRKVNRGVYMATGSQNSLREFSMPDLEDVGGNLYISYTANNASMATPSTQTALEFEKLERVGGNFTLSVTTSKIETLSCPNLKSIGGDFTMGTGRDASGLIGFGTLSFPDLSAIGGKLTIQPTLASGSNTKLTNLDGFAALARVGSIEVTRQGALTSYEGLKELFKTLTEEQWILPTNNGYNPTYQDLKTDGKWTKP